MAYLGNNLQAAYSSYLNIDDIRASFNGVTTTFPLRVSGASPVPFPINPQQCLISVNGVVLRPDDTATEGFRLVGTDIVFKNAPAGGATFFGIILAGADYINVGANFPDGTATVPSITFDQDTDTGFYRLSSGSAGFTSNGTKTVTFDTSSLTVDVAGVNIRGSRIIDCSNSTGNLTIFGGAGNGANIGLYGGSHPTLANLAVFNSNEHRFRTADGITERLRIDTSGRVGIGTNNPQATLDVSAKFRVDTTNAFCNLSLARPDGTHAPFIRGADSTGTAPALRLGDLSGSQAAVDISGAGNIIFYTNTATTERLRIDSSGQLTVAAKANGTTNGVIYNVPYTGGQANAVSQVLAVDTGTANALARINMSTVDLSLNNGGFISFATSPGGAGSPVGDLTTERMRISPAGNVGIGTSSPENKFEVIGDGNRIVCRNATNGGEARIEAQVQNYTSGSTFIGTAISQYGSTATGTTGGQANANLGVLTFQNTSTGLIYTNGATPLVFGTTSVERMRLTGIGTLALGTSVAPIGTHEFCWQGSHRCAFRNVDSTASNCNGLLIAYDNAAPNGTGNDFLLCTDNAATRAAIRSNGGIANFQANNVNLSDINLKKNILPANSTWEHLKQWEIVSYQYKDQSNESDLNFGVIAQQVAEISPEVITVFQEATQGQPDQLGVKEQQMYWMAIKALQEAVDRIETLENKVTALETA